MTDADAAAARLHVRGLSKRFEAVRALIDAILEIEPGSIHALLGENGAGKSTLVKIITGLETADEGSLLLDGQEVRFSSPMEARSAGVSAPESFSTAMR